MGTAASAEPCVYERLWESIAVLRESGHRYGMSERDIERFITQVLQTNEPQDQDRDQDQDQPGFPLLRATAKWALALCLLLVLGLSLSLSLSPSGPLSLGFNWTCPLGAARLLELPIAHKYRLREFRWRPLQKSSENSSCAEEPRVLKGGGGWSMQRSQLERLFQTHPDSVSIRALDSGIGLDSGVPQGPANYSVHWRPPGGSSQDLLPLLFPAAQHLLQDSGDSAQHLLQDSGDSAQRLLQDSGDSALRRCVVLNLRPSLPQLHTQGLQVQSRLLLGAGRALLSMTPLCPPHTPTRLELRPGDRVLCDPRLWRTELLPGPGQTVFCDSGEGDDSRPRGTERGMTPGHEGRRGGRLQATRDEEGDDSGL